jgi:hypothetical protein
MRPAKAPAGEHDGDRPTQTLLSVLHSLLQAAEPVIGSNGAFETQCQKPRRSPYRAATAAPVRKPVAGVAPCQRAPAAPQQAARLSRSDAGVAREQLPGMAGPLHADFVRQHNMTPQALNADAIMLLRFFAGGVERCGPGLAACGPAAVGLTAGRATAECRVAGAVAAAVAGAAAGGRAVQQYRPTAAIRTAAQKGRRPSRTGRRHDPGRFRAIEPLG